MSMVITGGGTGGHLTIAKAIKEELNLRGIQPLFVGSTYGQDREWFEGDSGWEACYFLETSGVVNKKGLAKLGALKDIFKAMMQARAIITKHQSDVVFSVGGYSAAPASFAAMMMKKRFYMHEQNAVMGRLNKLLAPKATMLFSSYHVYADDAVTDYPVRDIFFQNARNRQDIKSIIFLGGSQGARTINDFALSVAKIVDKKGIKIIHQCGKNELDRCRKFYHDSSIDAEVFDFSKALEEKIKEADFAIARAGASTVWELTASGLPALFIPYPYAAGDHQYHNAKFLAEKKLALLQREEALHPDILEDIWQLDLKTISKNLRGMIAPDGAKKIVDIILDSTTTS
jgi:UDP-N-acetylglucosamine--N-acetylmuramyl-(pentapeptide) pyrophosphoryl-undecaprenol N-acetylglucosamine transferase